MRTVPFKTFLVTVPFPLVTTFEMAGTYKKWLWPNSAYIRYMWHALLFSIRTEGCRNTKLVVNTCSMASPSKKLCTPKLRLLQICILIEI